MGKITQYVFWLVLIMILVVYWKGTTSVAGTFGGAINTIIRTLQGRKDDGSFAEFPKQ